MTDNRDRKWAKRRKRENPKRLKVIKRLLKNNLNSIGSEPDSTKVRDYSKDVLKFLKKCRNHWPLMGKIGESHPDIRKIIDARKEEGMELLWEYNHRNW